MRPRAEKRGLVAVPSSMELSRAKTRSTAGAWGTEQPFYKPYQRSSGMTGSSTARLPANATRRSTSKPGRAAIIRASATR
jgi:hypothetical protein